VVDLSIVLLAGGEATRLRGKLFLDVGGIAMVARVHRNLSGRYPTYLACDALGAPDLRRILDAPIIVDRWMRRGPLSGILSAMDEIATHWVFVAPGDAPFLDASFVDRLAAYTVEEVEAIVPRRAVGGRSMIEPLVAIYSRSAFLREGLPLFAAGVGSPRPVIERLRTRYVDVHDELPFINVNTPQEYERICAMLP